MVSTQTPICDFGWKARDFSLQGVDGKTWSLADARGPNGTLIMFICNHCPYVKAIAERLVRDVKELQDHGIGVIAVMSNDPTDYPEDSFDKMKSMAGDWAFTFPYVIDPTQEIAKSYGAVCTPDFFGFNADLGLQYRGRLDQSRQQPGPVDARRDLFEAMRQVARTGHGPVEQIPSMGCSIKWIGEGP
ncbi:MAG TPA: thioredoxin family protein [Rhodospirillales bacterium]|nr:thioredoxin family protein [Rhodospirillales bacterium]